MTIRSLLSPLYICHASMSCLVLFMHKMPCALIFALLNAGNSIAARMAMIAMTTNSSIRVKADFRFRMAAWLVAEIVEQALKPFKRKFVRWRGFADPRVPFRCLRAVCFTRGGGQCTFRVANGLWPVDKTQFFQFRRAVTWRKHPHLAEESRRVAVTRQPQTNFPQSEQQHGQQQRH